MTWAGVSVTWAGVSMISTVTCVSVDVVAVVIAVARYMTAIVGNSIVGVESTETSQSQMVAVANAEASVVIAVAVSVRTGVTRVASTTRSSCSRSTIPSVCASVVVVDGVRVSRTCMRMTWAGVSVTVQRVSVRGTRMCMIQLMGVNVAVGVILQVVGVDQRVRV